MTLDESAVSELLDALLSADGGDMVRRIAEWGLQALIETEFTGVIGAGPLRTQRHPHRRAQRAPAKARVDRGR